MSDDESDKSLMKGAHACAHNAIRTCAKAVKKLRATPLPSPGSSLNCTLTRCTSSGAPLVAVRRLYCVLSCLNACTISAARSRSTCARTKTQPISIDERINNNNLHGIVYM